MRVKRAYEPSACIAVVLGPCWRLDALFAHKDLLRSTSQALPLVSICGYTAAVDAAWGLDFPGLGSTCSRLSVDKRHTSVICYADSLNVATSSCACGSYVVSAHSSFLYWLTSILLRVGYTNSSMAAAPCLGQSAGYL